MDLPNESSTKRESPSKEVPAGSMASDAPRAAALFEQSVAIMARLRAPGGCPWDREQSFESIRKYTLEETYEVFDAIERRDWPHLAEESPAAVSTSSAASRLLPTPESPERMATS